MAVIIEQGFIDEGTSLIIRHMVESGVTPAVLLGAGASFESGVPGASDIASNVRKRLYPFEVFDGVDQDNQLTKFENVMSSVSGGDQLITQILARYLEDLTPSSSHRKLIDLIVTSRLAPWIFTTNYDTLIEQSLSERNIEFSVHLPGEEIDRSEEIVRLVKLHGCITTPDTVCCTPERIIKLPKPTSTVFEEITTKYGLLIIGHSLRDPDLNSCFLSASPTRGLVAVISPGASQTESLPILTHHRCESNLGNSSFAKFIETLHSIRSLQSAYENELEELPKLWGQLDEGRFGIKNPALLSQIESSSANLRGRFPNVHEVHALFTLTKAYSIGQVGWWQMNEAIRTLGEAVKERGDLPIKARASLVGRYLFESLLAIWAGADLKLAFGKEDTPTVLKELVDLGVDERKFLLQESKDKSKHFLLDLALAEAMKELFAIDVSGAPHADLLLRAEELLLGIIHPSDSIDALGKWNSGVFQRGIAFRHLAVVHEYLASLERGKNGRLKHLRLWHNYSAEAVQILGTINERWVKSFAQMNQAMSAITLRKEDEPGMLPDQVALQSLSLLDEANEVFLSGEDERSIAWSQYQMAHARIQLTETGLLDLQDEVEIIYRLAAGGARSAKRAQTDPVVAGMSDHLASFALLTMAKSSDGKRKLDLLAEVIETARRSRTFLKGGHRVGAAAKSAQIESEALLLLSDAGSISKAEATADGIVLLADALALLLRTGFSNENDCENELFELRSAIARLVPNLGI